LALQIQVGTGEGRFQEKLSEVLAGAGRGCRRGVFLAQGLKGLGKKPVHILEVERSGFLLDQPFQFGLLDFNRHLWRAALGLLLL
jgi:hypothetical protein